LQQIAILVFDLLYHLHENNAGFFVMTSNINDGRPLRRICLTPRLVP